MLHKRKTSQDKIRQLGPLNNESSKGTIASIYLES